MRKTATWTLTALALSATALAASGQVTFSFANVALDGETKLAAGTTITAANGQQVPSSILYTDAAGGKTNYLPIRAISELLGVEIGYDSATKTVLLGEQACPLRRSIGKGRWTARALPTPAKGPKRPIPYRLSGALPGCRRGGSCRRPFTVPPRPNTGLLETAGT